MSRAVAALLFQALLKFLSADSSSCTTSRTAVLALLRMRHLSSRGIFAFGIPACDHWAATIRSASRSAYRFWACCRSESFGASATTACLGTISRARRIGVHNYETKDQTHD
jgi:hypothetical protein